MKTIYLHLGFHKTASTSFQQSCLKNSDLLNTHGIHYPSYTTKTTHRGEPHSNHSFMIEMALFGNDKYHIGGRSNRRLAKQKIHSTKGRKDLANHLSKELEIITENRSPSTIISGEHISTWSVNRLIRLREYFDAKNCAIKPFALVRSPIEYVTSAVQELIKGGNYLPYISINNSGIDLVNSDSLKVPQSHQRIINLNHAFEGQIYYAPFRKACEHKYGPVGFILEELIETKNCLLNQFEFIKLNESRSNLWVRVQNEINKVYPRYTKRNGHVCLNSLEVKLPSLTQAESKQEKFRLTEEEYRLIEKHISNSENAIKEALGSEYIYPHKEFSPPDNLAMEDIVRYLIRAKKIRHSTNICP